MRGLFYIFSINLLFLKIYNFLVTLNFLSLAPKKIYNVYDIITLRI